MHAKITDQQAVVKKRMQDELHVKIVEKEEVISDHKTELNKEMQAQWTKWKTVLEASIKEKDKAISELKAESSKLKADLLACKNWTHSTKKGVGLLHPKSKKKSKN